MLSVLFTILDFVLSVKKYYALFGKLGILLSATAAGAAVICADNENSEDKEPNEVVAFEKVA